MVRDLGAEAVVLAGAELTLAIDGQDPGYPVIDALDVHVALLAVLASGRADLRDLRQGSQPGHRFAPPGDAVGVSIGTCASCS